MNKQNFESENSFPLSTKALTFMQDMVMASAQLAQIGGDNYILSGCETSGNNVAPGIIVINGEVMPFEGGAKVRTITIIETPESIIANGLPFDNIRVTRKAKFATGTGANYYPWANFKPLKTNKQLEELKATVKYVDDEIRKIQAVPTGVIVMWSGAVSNIPKGWQLCDYSIIPGTNKRTPDLRGRFIVGYSKDESDYGLIGKTGGKKSVTLSKDELPSHSHSFKNYFYSEKDRSAVGGDGYDQFSKNIIGSNDTDEDNNRLYYMNSTTNSTGSGNAFDNRPPYYVLAYIIKIDVKY